MATGHGGRYRRPAWATGLDGVALKGEGGDVLVDHLEYFADHFPENAAIAFTLYGLEGDRSFMGGLVDGSQLAGPRWYHSTGAWNVEETPVFHGIDDLGDDRVIVSPAENNLITDEDPIRVVVNKTGEYGGDAFEFYVDGQPVETTVHYDEATQDAFPVVEEFTIFSDVGDEPYEGIVDNLIFFDESLTAAEIEHDYQTQPWS